MTSGVQLTAFSLSGFNTDEALDPIEKQHLIRVLEQVGQDRKEAARLLDISLSSLYRKIEEFDIA